MLTLAEVALYRGARCLFEDASFTVHAGQKVGVTGRNGTGKSSLLALVRGELQPEHGRCELPAGTRIAHVAQETPALKRGALDFVIDGDRALRALEAQLAEAEVRGDGAHLAELHARYEQAQGYSARARAGRLLHGLGFTVEDEACPVSAFSGGWRMRLNLAQALMCPSDLLLLDEPTNHLDLDAVLWLERWLRDYPGTLLLISHDREFLDAVIGHVAHIEGRRIELCRGDYSAFERRRAERIAQQQHLRAVQEREIAAVRAFVERFRAKATKARQAQSRLKTLQRMELIECAHVDGPFHFRFREPPALPSPLLRLEGVAAGYGEHMVLSGIELGIEPGLRIGLLGRNGAGKSTLVKVLAGELAPSAGQRLAAKGLRLGFFTQHQLERLRPEDSPIAALGRLAPEAPEQALRDYLGGFDFRGERVFEPGVNFSGGEKARLVLAMIAWQAPNLLLLDEPTNHLDLEMRQALARALQDYPGALVLVSHDRHLLRATTDRFLLVDRGRAGPFDGDLEDYRRWLLAGEETPGPPANDKSHSAAARRLGRRRAAKRRQQRQPLLTRIRELERELQRLAEERARLEADLAGPGLYAEDQRERLRECILARERVERESRQLEHSWLGLHEELERLDAGVDDGSAA